MTTERQHAPSKCPACGSANIHASRRRSKLEEISAFAGISYFRCDECKLRFSRYMGGFTSHSMRGRYELVKQRAKELLFAGVILAGIVASMVYMLYHNREP